MTHWANSLSLYYQAIQPSFMPTFEKYDEPDPIVEEDITPVLPLLYHQEHAIQTSDLPALFSNMFTTTSRISVRISALDVRAIHAWVSSNTKGAAIPVFRPRRWLLFQQFRAYLKRTQWSVF